MQAPLSPQPHRQTGLSDWAVRLMDLCQPDRLDTVSQYNLALRFSLFMSHKIFNHLLNTEEPFLLKDSVFDPETSHRLWQKHSSDLHTALSSHVPKLWMPGGLSSLLIDFTLRNTLSLPCIFPCPSLINSTLCIYLHMKFLSSSNSPSQSTH